MSLNFSLKSLQTVRICCSLTMFTTLTFNDGHHIIRLVSVAGQVLGDLNSAFQFSPEKIAFVEEEDQLGLR